jgi:hypothetical protein
MISAVNKLKWDEFRRKFLTWWNKSRSDQSIRVDRASERSINILQKRYGYTREEAESQLNKHYSKARLD